MLSRGNSDASRRLRRAKSSSSVQTVHHHHINSSENHAGIVPHHALTAASLAFERANERGFMINGSTEIQPREQAVGMPNGEKGRRLIKKQSIRFTGANAIPIRHSSITRRHVPASKYSHGSPYGGRDSSGIFSETSSRYSESNILSSPYKGEEYIETRVSSIPSSYRKLRKSKSMFNPLRHRLVRSNSGLIQSSVQVQPRFANFSVHQGKNAYATEPLGKKAPFQVEEAGRLTPTANIHASHDVAIRIAREEYLRQLDEQRLKGKASLASLGKTQTPQKVFRKTVRTGSSSTDSKIIGLSSAAHIESTSKTKLGHKARNFSLSLKNKLKRVFHRSSGTESYMPAQQLTATRRHFNNYPLASPGLSSKDNHVQSPDATLHDSVSLEAYLGGLPSYSDKRPYAGSIRSIQSDDEAAHEKSRVTSWTDSNAASTFNSIPVFGKKRLSIIRENDGPYQPSAPHDPTDNRSPFHGPVRNSDLATQLSGPLDSRRIYSALQKRIDENKRLAKLPEHQDIIEDSTENRISQDVVLSQAVHNDCGTDAISLGETSENHARAEKTNSSALSKYDFTENKVEFERENSSTERVHQELLDMYTDLLPDAKKFAESEENETSCFKRRLEEVDSAFSPLSTRIERTDIGPKLWTMGKIEKAECRENENTSEVETSKSLSVSNGLTRTILRSKSAIGMNERPSESFVKDIVNQNGSSISLTSFKDTTRPGATTVTSEERKSYDKIHAPSPCENFSASKSSTDWHEWMNKRAVALGKSNWGQGNHPGVENLRPFPARANTKKGHKRENAQTDEDDVQIGRLQIPDNSPKQPLAVLQNNAVPGSNLKKRSAWHMIDRFPGKETRKPELLLTTLPASPTTPPPVGTYASSRNDSSTSGNSQRRYGRLGALARSKERQRSRSTLRQRQHSASNDFLPRTSKDSPSSTYSQASTQMNNGGSSNFYINSDRFSHFNQWKVHDALAWVNSRELQPDLGGYQSQQAHTPPESPLPQENPGDDFDSNFTECSSRSVIVENGVASQDGKMSLLAEKWSHRIISGSKNGTDPVFL